MGSSYTGLAIQYAEWPITGLTAGSEETAQPASHLTTADLGELWQSQGLSPYEDTHLSVTLGTAQPTAGIVLTRHNGRPGSLWRVQGDTATIAPPARVDPTAVAGSGVTGAATDIDEGVDTFSKSDSVGVNPDSTAEITLGNSSGTLATGAHTQAIRLVVDTSSGEFGEPVSFELRDSSVGTLLHSWADVAITEHDQIVELYFDGSLRTTGADLRLDVFWSSSASFPLSIWALEWRPELASSATGADSGWLELVPSPEVFAEADFDDRPSSLVRGTAGHHFITDGVLDPKFYRFWRITIRDPNNPDGYLRASNLALGPSARLNAQDGFQVRSVDTSRRVRMANGDLWIDLKPTYHVMSLPVRALSGEGPRDLQAIRSRAGSKPMGISVFPEEPEASALTIRGVLTDGGITHRTGQGSGDHRAIGWTDTLTIEEV